MTTPESKRRPKLYLVSRWFGPGDHEAIGVFDPNAPKSPPDPVVRRRLFRGKLVWEVDCRAWRDQLRSVGIPVRRKFRSNISAQAWCDEVIAQCVIRYVVARAATLRPRKRRERNKDAKITNRIRYRVLKRDAFHCMACGATGKEAVLVVDHIVPVSKGGKTVMSNLQTLCETCNSGKGDLLP